MSYVPNEKTKLVYALMAKRIPEEQFFRDFPATRESIHEVILSLLERGLDEKDVDSIEQAIPLAYRYGLSKDFLSALNALAVEPWHYRHEDIVFALGKLKDPSSVPILARTAEARHPYLEEDEFFALGSKSIYALENIGTVDAVRVLGILAESPNDVLRNTARKRLKNITESGEREDAKAAAKTISDRLDN